MRMIRVLCIGLAFSMTASQALAGDATIDADGSATWASSTRGPWIEFNPDGSVKRIYSKYSAPVEFPDRRGIHKAQVIAEEKAKAEIVRFLKQDIATTRVVVEVQNDVYKATQERETGSTAKTRKVDSRTVQETLTEITASFAAGELKGVIVLEEGYDEKAEEAWVVVGVSEKTINAARGAQRMLSVTEDGKPEQSDAAKTQPGEVRTTPQKDW